MKKCAFVGDYCEGYISLRNFIKGLKLFSSNIVIKINVVIKLCCNCTVFFISVTFAVTL